MDNRQHRIITFERRETNDMVPELRIRVQFWKLKLTRLCKAELERKELHTESFRDLQRIPLSFNLSTDQCMHMRKLPKAREITT